MRRAGGVGGARRLLDGRPGAARGRPAPADAASPADAAPEPDAADPPPLDASIPSDAAAPAPDAGEPEPPRLAADAAWRLAPPVDGGRWWLLAPEVDLPNDRDVVRYAPWCLLGRRGDTGFDLVAVNVHVGDDARPEPWISETDPSAAPPPSSEATASEITIHDAHARVIGSPL